VGRSLGAGAALFRAEKGKAAGAPVALVVTFGPTVTLVAPSNVSQVINYYAGNTIVTKGPGFKGTISNVDLNSAPDINHLNVEKSNRLHAAVISKIQAIAGRGRTGSVAGHGRTSPTAEQGRAPTGVQGRASPAATVQ
jgi:hypothetical protein